MKATVGLALLVFIAACGTSQRDSESVLQISATEFEFRPDSWVIGPEPAEVELINSGSIVHEWVVLGRPIESEAEFMEDDVLIRIEAEGGATSGSLVDLRPGLYQVICSIDGHFSAGMEGTLVVEAP